VNASNARGLEESKAHLEATNVLKGVHRKEIDDLGEVIAARNADLLKSEQDAEEMEKVLKKDIDSKLEEITAQQDDLEELHRNAERSRLEAIERQRLGKSGKPLVDKYGNPLGPDGKPLYLLGPDGKPLLGPDGKPLKAGDYLLGPDGKPLLGPDGKPIRADGSGQGTNNWLTKIGEVNSALEEKIDFERDARLYMDRLINKGEIFLTQNNPEALTRFPTNSSEMKFEDKMDLMDSIETECFAVADKLRLQLGNGDLDKSSLMAQHEAEMENLTARIRALEKTVGERDSKVSSLEEEIERLKKQVEEEKAATAEALKKYAVAQEAVAKARREKIQQLEQMRDMQADANDIEVCTYMNVLHLDIVWISG